MQRPTSKRDGEPVLPAVLRLRDGKLSLVLRRP